MSGLQLPNEDDLRARLEAFNLSQVARDLNVNYMRLYRFMREGRSLPAPHRKLLGEYINGQHRKSGTGRKPETYLRRALVAVKKPRKR